MVKFSPTTDRDLHELACNLRVDDLLELYATHGNVAPFDAIRKSVAASSEVFSAASDGKFWCVFGIAPLGALLTPIASPWMLGVPEASRHPAGLVRATRRYLAEVRERFPLLVNYVDARNKPSLGYLKAVGFTIDPEPQPYGAAGLPFHRFHMGLE